MQKDSMKPSEGSDSIKMRIWVWSGHKFTPCNGLLHMELVTDIGRTRKWRSCEAKY